jgi:glycosyltransferase involved in cell wall biosynthesis
LIIGQVMRSFGSGGAQRSAINLALGLSELGHDSRILALGEPGGFALQVADRIPCDALGITGGVQALRGVGRLRSLIRQRGFDALHIHGSGVLPLVAAAVMGMGAAAPTLHFTWHDSGSVLGGGRLKRHLTCWALDRCKTVYGSSAAVASKLQDAWGHGSVDIMRNGVPDGGRLGAPAAPVPTVVWAARIVPEKRPEWFIRAAAAARQAGLPGRFVLAGSPLPRNQAYFDEVRDLARELGEPVEFVGWVERPELLYRDAAIGVQTSQTEGLSMVLLEQMMAGLAVVATDVGDTADALDGGRYGILVDSGDEAGFTTAVLGLLGDSSLRMSLADAARGRAVQEYSCRAMAERSIARYAGNNV